MIGHFSSSPIRCLDLHSSHNLNPEVVDRPLHVGIRNGTGQSIPILCYRFTTFLQGPFFSVILERV